MGYPWTSYDPYISLGKPSPKHALWNAPSLVSSQITKIHSKFGSMIENVSKWILFAEINFELLTKDVLSEGGRGGLEYLANLDSLWKDLFYHWNFQLFAEIGFKLLTNRLRIKHVSWYFNLPNTIDQSMSYSIRRQK